MFETVKNTYGIDLRVASEINLTKLPLYMIDGRRFYEVCYEEIPFLLVEIASMNKFVGSIALEKQLNRYQKAVDMPVAYIFGKLTYAQRLSLINRKIPFISEPDQIFLPFLGVMLRKMLSKKTETVDDKMKPATQSLFLYMVYNGKDGCLKKDAADFLGLTRTSITRASEQLKSMGLIREEKNGREIMMYPVTKGREYYEAAKPYLINPVQKTIYIDGRPDKQRMVLTGESALSRKTMLNAPRISEFAIDKSKFDIKNITEADPVWGNNEKIVQISLWKYDPLLFACDGIVDPISLVMTMQKLEDERIEEALDEYMEEYKW